MPISHNNKDNKKYTRMSIYGNNIGGIYDKIWGKREPMSPTLIEDYNRIPTLTKESYLLALFNHSLIARSALVPVPPKNKSNRCTQKMMKIVNDNSTLEEDASEAVKQDFESNPDFEIAYINKNENVLYKTWMSDGTTQDKLLGYKALFSYPYSRIVFDIGQYIYFDYYDVGIKNKKDWSCWLLESLDYQNYYDVNGRIYPCNENMKWKNKVVFDYPCYMEDSMKYTTLNLGQQGVTEPDCDIVVFIQKNVDTDYIYINQRFLLAGRAYAVIQENVEMSNKIIKLFLNKVQEQQNDDFENGIAWNGEEIKDPITPTITEDILLPNIDGIKQNNNIPFSIYEYVDGVKTNTTFVIEVSGVDSTYYTLDIKDMNNFDIKCLKSNKVNPLKIKLTNSKTRKITTKEIWLRGLF